MSNILSFEFEELPLVIAVSYSQGNAQNPPVPAGLINGCAEIEYTRSGEWSIQSVCVEGYQTLTAAERAAGKKPWVYVKAPTALEDMICHRLENEWFDKVQDAIREQLASDREDAAEQRAEMRRDHLMDL